MYKLIPVILLTACNMADVAGTQAPNVAVGCAVGHCPRDLYRVFEVWANTGATNGAAPTVSASARTAGSATMSDVEAFEIIPDPNHTYATIYVWTANGKEVVYFPMNSYTVGAAIPLYKNISFSSDWGQIQSPAWTGDSSAKADICVRTGSTVTGCKTVNQAWVK